MGKFKYEGDAILKRSFAALILGFALFFFFVTPFRLFLYWKIPLLEDNVATLIWILPVLAFFPLYQFIKQSISKTLVKILLIVLTLLFIGEIFVDGYIGILLIFEGFIISLLLIYSLRILFAFYNNSPHHHHYKMSLFLAFVIAALGASF